MDNISANKNLIKVCKGLVDKNLTPQWNTLIHKRIALKGCTDKMGIVRTTPILSNAGFQSVIVQESDDMVCIGYDLKKSLDIVFNIADASLVASQMNTAENFTDITCLPVYTNTEYHLQNSLEYALFHTDGSIRSTWYLPLIYINFQKGYILFPRTETTMFHDSLYIMGVDMDSRYNIYYNLEDLSTDRDFLTSLKKSLKFVYLAAVTSTNLFSVVYRINNAMYISDDWKHF